MFFQQPTQCVIPIGGNDVTDDTADADDSFSADSVHFTKPSRTTGVPTDGIDVFAQ